MSEATVTKLRARSFSDEVAANVRAEMARQQVQQKTVAQVLGVPQTVVSDRARGRTPWTLNELEAVARLLGTTASALCAIRDSNPEPADSDTPLARVIDLAAWSSSTHRHAAVSA